MTEFGPEIDAALSSDAPIPRERILYWIESSADSDLVTLSKLYRLTGDGYYRIQPDLGMEPTCLVIQRYLLGCVRDGVTDHEDIEERYEASQSLHIWFRHLLAMEGTSSILLRAASAIRNLYLTTSGDVRDAIETGFLEHALETTALRQYFEDWAFDPRLAPAWNRALEWGKAHPDYMAGLFQRPQQKDKA